MRTIIEVTLKMTKEEMMKLLEDFIQYGKHQVKLEGGPMVNFVCEGNGVKDLGNITEAAIAAAATKRIIVAKKGGRIDE